MSRAEREIAALRVELESALSRLQDERRAIREASRLYPDCPGCAALRVALDAARETIDDMARRAVGAPPAGAQSAVPSVG